MPFDIRQLRHAIAAADCRSFHRASEALNIKRSTLSRSIFRLEDCLGVTLFMRTPSGISPTRVGREFIREARHIVNKVDQLVADMHAAGQGRVGGLTIGYNVPVSAGNLHATLLSWRESNPDVEIDAVEAQRTDLVNGLNKRAVDIAILPGEVSYSEIKRAAFWSERVLVAMAADHPLAAYESVQWSDLRDETFWLTANDPGPETRDMLLGRLSAFGARPKIKMQPVSRESIMNMLGAGVGVTITCEGAAGLQYPNVVLREVRTSHGLCLIAYSGYWREDNSNPALKNFLGFVRDRFALPFCLP
ncbi:HTH-type transcriptional regulator GltC [Ensifer psoraleae]|uniref:LysR family transcriptional regulator n=1 Tax=Sinorhizobium psoraleae TaxID=520838 RepID=UPI0015681BE2|nr:LysR family transcriptional regulator [Sinorhizobium psoraleae]NRP74529.1 HTH-type transcriptional regulator GltC [Sinorhizobium psoraleae]